MILSKYARVMDISWTDFFWNSAWILLLFGLYTAGIMGTAWSAGIAYNNRNLPKKYKDQEAEIKELKEKLKTAINERDHNKGKLLSIKESVEVRGI